MSDEPHLIPQPHGGALLSAGVPGNAGGGRPRSELRGSMREVLHLSIALLRNAVEAGELPPPGIQIRDFLKAVDVLAKHSLREEPKDWRSDKTLERMAEAVEETLHDRDVADAAGFMSDLVRRWRVILPD